MKIDDKIYPKLLIYDIVSSTESENIRNYLMHSNVKWVFYQNTVSSNFFPRYEYLDNLIDSWQLVNNVVGENQIHDHATFEIIRPIIDNFIKREKLKDFYIHKIKINTLFQKKDIEPFHFNTPHQDSEEEGFSTLIYYVNTSDGNTIFFRDENNDINSKLTLTIEDGISPKEGSAILFKSNQYHASSNPIKTQRRLVINIVFKTYE